jgi:hypothetical protein
VKKFIFGFLFAATNIVTAQYAQNANAEHWPVIRHYRPYYGHAYTNAGTLSGYTREGVAFYTYNNNTWFPGVTQLFACERPIWGASTQFLSTRADCEGRGRRLGSLGNISSSPIGYPRLVSPLYRCENIHGVSLTTKNINECNWAGYYYGQRLLGFAL